jgi:hypothetical protein
MTRAENHPLYHPIKKYGAVFFRRFQKLRGREREREAAVYLPNKQTLLLVIGLAYISHKPTNEAQGTSKKHRMFKYSTSNP